MGYFKWFSIFILREYKTVGELVVFSAFSTTLECGSASICEKETQEVKTTDVDDSESISLPLNQTCF